MKVEFLLDKQRSPDTEKGMKVVYGGSKRTGYRIRWFLMLTALITPIVFLAYHLLRDEVLTIAPGVVTYEPITLSSPEDGLVEKIMVNKGDFLRVGSPLYRIRNRLLENEVDFLESELVKLEQAEERNRKLNLELYQHNVTEAEAYLKDVSKVKERYDEFSRKGQVSVVDYTQVVAIHHQAKSAYVAARIEYNRAVIESENIGLTGPLAEDIRSIRAELSRKRAQRDRLLVSSPIEGYVLDSNASEGEHVAYGDDLMLLAEKANAEISAYLAPEHVDFAKQGQEVTVLFPDKSRYSGIISTPTEIASKLPPTLAKPFEAQKSLLKITVQLHEPPGHEELIEGMPVEVIF